MIVNQSLVVVQVAYVSSSESDAINVGVSHKTLVIGILAFLRKIYEMPRTALTMTITKVSHFTTCQIFIAILSILDSLQNMHIGRTKIMKTAEMIKKAYQKAYMFMPALFLTLETSRGTIRSIVWARMNPSIIISFIGSDFSVHRDSTG